MSRCKLCSHSNVCSEHMLTPCTFGEIVRYSRKESHGDSEYDYSSSGPFSTLHYSTFSFSSRKFRDLFFWAAIQLLLTMTVSFNDLSLTIRLLMVSSAGTIYQARGLFTATRCRTADIFLPSEILQECDTIWGTHFHCTTSPVLTTNPFSSHCCRGVTTTSIASRRTITSFPCVLSALYHAHIFSVERS